ncbi:tubulin binding cofactor A [Echria macrotheca]|uniref:Tubulin-specific chaperone A n=1 Tax=Echria macrotheca TaxID=438768 RepID=A0AAJ0BCY1_9PEZI|nr:tubulin binding cofactor A [Echria macrotheca]
MPPPSGLKIATQAVERLVKEEGYYHQEQAKQEERVKKLEQEISAGGDGSDFNAEFVLKQEKKALEETKKVFSPLLERLVLALNTLEEKIYLGENEGTGTEEELNKAKEALQAGYKLTGSDPNTVSELGERAKHEEVVKGQENSTQSDMAEL